VENGVLERRLMRSVGLTLRRVHVSVFSVLVHLVSSLKPTRNELSERVSTSRAKYCRSYANELRAVAVHVKSEPTRQTLLRVANDFDRMADTADAIAHSKTLPTRPRWDS
jgi:hypothetical protein